MIGAYGEEQDEIKKLKKMLIERKEIHVTFRNDIP